MVKKILFSCVALLLVSVSIFVWQRRGLVPSSSTAEENYFASDTQDICIEPANDTYFDYASDEPRLVAGTMEAQVANLQKLAMVWGFTKYTHLAFLTGEKCWDEELLNLIPIIQFADPQDVNDILYEWFVGLGDDGYSLDWVTMRINILDSLREFSEYYYLAQEVFPDDLEMDWLAFQNLRIEFNLLSGFEASVRHRANLEWISDASFLGESLTTALSRFVEVQIFDRSNAPVSFDNLNNSVFTNESSGSGDLMDFNDVKHRLLGLFRLWNAMKYYYPHMDIIDYDWCELLLYYISEMLKGTDRISYRTTLVSLARRLDDAHIMIDGVSTHAFERPIDIVGLAPYVLLENNIGLINPDHRIFSPGDIRHIMETFKDTDGLIIDLRQYPCFSIVYELAEYIVEERQRFFVFTFPSDTVPGEFIYVPNPWLYSGGIESPYAFFYDKPVVILMNRSTMSRAEHAVMSLRNGKNVTVMGTNSIGANGNVTFLPLPGGMTMQFTGLGIYTQDGDQTHRIGLSPDIYVDQTEAGIVEGYDELFEAALKYLTGNPSS